MQPSRARSTSTSDGVPGGDHPRRRRLAGRRASRGTSSWPTSRRWADRPGHPTTERRDVTTHLPTRGGDTQQVSPPRPAAPTAGPADERPGPVAPAAEPAGRPVLALPLHLAVLHPLPRRRPVPAGLHGLGLAPRLEPARRQGRLRRPRQLPRGARRTPTSGSSWTTRSASSCSRPSRRSHRRWSSPALLDNQLRGADVLADERAAALRRRPGRRRPHLRQPVRRPVRPRQPGARPGRASTPSHWHTNRFASHVAIATMVNWRWTGYNALILLAAMQAVPRDSTRRRRSTAPAGSASSSRSPSR